MEGARRSRGALGTTTSLKWIGWGCGRGRGWGCVRGIEARGDPTGGRLDVAGVDCKVMRGRHQGSLHGEVYEFVCVSASVDGGRYSLRRRYLYEWPGKGRMRTEVRTASRSEGRAS